MKKIITGILSCGVMVASLMSQAAERPGLSRGDETETEEREVLVARTETAGTLASVIGDRKLSVDSIVVEDRSMRLISMCFGKRRSTARHMG